MSEGLFWIGLRIGLFVGANMGILIIALYMAAGRGDKEMENGKN
jgi:hypothetical protein